MPTADADDRPGDALFAHPERRVALACASAAAALRLARGARRAPGRRRPGSSTRPGEIVPIPASIPHEEGDMVDTPHRPRPALDRRTLPDLRHRRLLRPAAQRRTRRLRRSCHVATPTTTTASPSTSCPSTAPSRKCDAAWNGITRLAEWAEPLQNQPVAALPLGRLRRRRRPRLRPPPPPLLEPRPGRPVRARRMGRSLPCRPAGSRAASAWCAASRKSRRRNRSRPPKRPPAQPAPPGGISSRSVWWRLASRSLT